MRKVVKQNFEKSNLDKSLKRRQNSFLATTQSEVATPLKNEKITIFGGCFWKTKNCQNCEIYKTVNTGKVALILKNSAYSKSPLLKLRVVELAASSQRSLHGSTA